jgi:hypothetical protein
VLPEEGEDELLVVIKKALVLGLQLADQGLAAGVEVQLGHDGKDTLGGGVIGGNISLATTILWRSVP